MTAPVRSKTELTAPDEDEQVPLYARNPEVQAPLAFHSATMSAKIAGRDVINPVENTNDGVAGNSVANVWLMINELLFIGIFQSGEANAGRARLIGGPVV